MRQYDPETGRFLSPDPFKGYMTDPASQHPYMYCRGNPIRYSDPSGYSAGVLVKKGGEGLLILSPAGGPTAPVIAGGAVVLIGTGYLIDIYTTPEGIETLRFAGEQILTDVRRIGRFLNRTKEETDRKIKDIMANPDKWEKIDEKEERPPKKGGISRRELWRHKDTGDEIERHVMKKTSGKPYKNHPHYGPVKHF